MCQEGAADLGAGAEKSRRDVGGADKKSRWYLGGQKKILFDELDNKELFQNSPIIDIISK